MSAMAIVLLYPACRPSAAHKSNASPVATGYDHGADDVAKVTVASGELLTGYHDAVYQQTTRFLSTLTDSSLDRVVDKSWDPPVTLGVRLISVISDDLQHAGQAAYLRGLVTQE